MSRANTLPERPRIVIPPEASRAFDNLVSRKSVHTRRAYRTDLAEFASWREAETEAHALADLLNAGRIKAGAIADKWQAATAPRMARATVKRRISMLRSFVAAASRIGLVEWTLTVERYSNLDIAAKKAGKRRNMAGPNPAELAKVRGVVLRAGTLEAKRDLAIVTLAENPALRRSEIAALDVGDIDFDAGEITFVGKGRLEPETLPLVPEVIADIRPWLVLRRGAGKSEPLFVRIRGSVMTQDRISDRAVYDATIRWGRRAELKRRLRPHGLRHAGITAIAEVIASDGIPLTEGMKLSRHRKVETFQRYVDKVQNRGAQILSKAARRLRS